MSRIWIVFGDTTTGGGSVVSGSPFTDIDGKPVARIGDSVVCLRHGPTVIVSGDATMIVDGQPIARHGDGLACLCSLVSVQQMHVHIVSGGGAKASASAAESATTAPVPTGAAPACVGVPGEYSYTADNETVQYYKPDGSLDSAVVSAPPTKPASDASATIMSTFGNTTVLARHVWSVAREVQELLTSKIGRPVTCNVI